MNTDKMKTMDITAATDVRGVPHVPASWAGTALRPVAAQWSLWFTMKTTKLIRCISDQKARQWTKTDSLEQQELAHTHIHTHTHTHAHICKHWFACPLIGTWRVASPSGPNMQNMNPKLFSIMASLLLISMWYVRSSGYKGPAAGQEIKLLPRVRETLRPYLVFARHFLGVGIL